jgi:hypothetical protein
MVTLSRNKIGIPNITNERLNELAARIKPVIEFDGVKHHIEKCDLRGESYVWSPVQAEAALALVEIVDIRTYHTFGYKGFFKPSIAEVIAQIPEDLIDQVTEFEIVAGPTTVDDLNEESVALNKGFHVATTRLYARA